MKEGPDIARIASLIGDPGRANMLTALLSGHALTATELAAEAGITAQTASTHLAKLADAGLVKPSRSGRHKYFSLADAEVAATLEALMGLAARKGHLRTRPGPADPELRLARVCYNHLAGDLGVQLLDSLLRRNLLAQQGQALALTPDGTGFVTQFGVSIAQLSKARRPVCKGCLDWSERRYHLAGTLGQALLETICTKGWASRVAGSRAIRFDPTGRTAFQYHFPI